MTAPDLAFEHWLRHRFPEINTALEELYFSAGKLLIKGGDAVESLQRSLVDEGRALIAAVLQDDSMPKDYEQGFHLLGNVGMYMAACRRHEVDMAPGAGESSLKEASTLAGRLGAVLGVAPRFMAAHLGTDNRAERGAYRSFTHLQDEHIFVDYNTLGVLAYKKAADALERILPLGVSHPVTAYLLRDANKALEEVYKYNEILDERLDVDRFFFNVRPYYKPYKVGRRDYRGANAGDFAGINVVDLLLGLCCTSDPFYLDILCDKQAYMSRPEQARLQRAMRQRSLLDQFLDELKTGKADKHLRENAAVFQEVCALHGRAYAFHHDVLVSKYIEHPAGNIPADEQGDLTASGPPLPVLLGALRKLRDLRLAAKRDDIQSRYEDLERLQS